MTASTSYHPAVEDNSIHLSAVDIDIPALLASAHHPKAGAVVLFSGETRDNSHGKEVAYLSYEAHESMANKMIADILEQAKQRWHLNIAMAVHRTGKVAVSETAVVVITTSLNEVKRMPPTFLSLIK